MQTPDIKSYESFSGLSASERCALVSNSVTDPGIFSGEAAAALFRIRVRLMLRRRVIGS